MTKRILAIMLVACVFLSVTPLFSLAADPVSYLDENGISQQTTTYTLLDSSISGWGQPGQITCIVVDDASAYTVSNRVTVYGTCMLILADGAQVTLTKGITVDESATFSIYAQSAGDDAGKLTVPASELLEDGDAGIGGTMNTDSGAINIYGGVLDVTGGTGGAGIGTGATSGLGEAASGNITVYGGSVTATGGSGACGIGAGIENSSVGVITIKNGTVVANGKNGAAGIGGGHGDNAGCAGVSISGGTVTASNSQYGAGIGGGNGSPCGPIVITGGQVSAQGGNYAAGIGAGYNGSTCTSITIEGGQIFAKGGNYAAGIGSGYGTGCACGEVKISGAVIDAYGKSASGIGGPHNSLDSVTVTLGSDSAILAGSTQDAMAETTITAYNAGRTPYANIRKAAVKADGIGYLYLTSAVAAGPTGSIFLLADNSETVSLDLGGSFRLNTGLFTFSGQVVPKVGCRVVESTVELDTLYMAVDHSLVLQQTKKATCTEDGVLIAYYLCTECEKAFSDSNGENEIAEELLPLYIESKLGHSFQTYVSDKNATCLEDGTKTAHCEHEGCEETDTIADEGSKLGHQFTNYVSDGNATCLEDGTKTAHCDHAGCEETDTIADEGSKLGHQFTNYVSDGNATCLEDGTKTAHCDHAGCEETDTIADEGSKLGHSFTNYVSNNDATCLEDGTKTAHCDHENCDATDTITDEGSKLGHQFTTYVSNNDATCLEDGTKTAHCDHAGCDATDTITDEGSKLGHKFTTYVSNNDATCLEDGTKTAHCEHAGCDATDTIVDEGTKLGHQFTNYVSDNNATCLEDGTKTAHCDHAGCDATDTIVDEGTKLGHQFTNYVSDNNATCLEDGTKTAHCDHAGCDVTDTIIDAGSKLEHNFTGECRDDGNGETHSYLCVNGCGEYGNPTPHTGGFICDECGYENVDAAKAEAVKILEEAAGDPQSDTMTDVLKTAVDAVNKETTVAGVEAAKEAGLLAIAQQHESEKPGPQPEETVLTLRIGDKEYTNIKGGDLITVTSLDVIQDITVLTQNDIDVEGMSEDWSMSTKFLDGEGRSVLEVQLFEQGDDYIVFNLQSHYADCPGADVQDFQIMLIRMQLEASDVYLGDANGDGAVDMKDVLLMRKYLAGLTDTVNFANADANEDGSLDMKDVLMIRKFLAGLIIRLGA